MATNASSTYQQALHVLQGAAEAAGQPSGAAEQVLQQFLERRGTTPQQLTPEALSALLFPGLDGALSATLPEESRRAALRELSEWAAAQQLGAMKRSGQRLEDLLEDTKAPGQSLFSDDDFAEESPADFSDEDFETEGFDEDEFEFEDPDYLAAPQVHRYDLADAAEQAALIRRLGRVTGVRSVMVCRQNGEVLQARSTADLTRLGSFTAAVIALLMGQSLKLFSAQVEGVTVCIRPLGEYAVAVVAAPGVNIGRLLSEVSGLEEKNSAA